MWGGQPSNLLAIDAEWHSVWAAVHPCGFSLTKTWEHTLYGPHDTGRHHTGRKHRKVVHTYDVFIDVPVVGDGWNGELLPQKPMHSAQRCCAFSDFGNGACGVLCLLITKREQKEREGEGEGEERNAEPKKGVHSGEETLQSTMHKGHEAAFDGSYYSFWGCPQLCRSGAPNPLPHCQARPHQAKVRRTIKRLQAGLGIDQECQEGSVSRMLSPHRGSTRRGGGGAFQKGWSVTV